MGTKRLDQDFQRERDGNRPGTPGTVAGIDPGKVGALVVVRDSRVLEVLTWTTTEDVAPRVMAACLRHGVGIAVVEWASASRGRGERMSPASRVTLGMRVQMAISGAGCAGARVTTCTPDQWRGRVLGLSAAVSGDAAKRAAEWACWGGGWRRDPVDLALEWPDDVERSSHIAEAACLAVYGRGGYHAASRGRA